MENWIEYKKAKVVYKCVGTGESTLVFLHGFLEESTMWSEIIPTFSNTHRIVCIDLLGHGASECVGYVHTMEEIADAVFTVFNKEKIEKATIIGHSMGGYVALAFAEKYTSYVDGLCLLNSTAQSDSEERKEIRSRAIAMAKTNYKPLVTMSVSNLFTTTAKETQKEEIERAKEEALKTPVQGYIACAEGMKLRKNREEVLKLKSFKKCIIAGEKDPILMFESIEKESERTNTEVIKLSSGHMSHIENKQELIVALQSFIND